ncbi:LysR family transcriptional regulator [Rhodospirillum rubrum]|uniref:LysR family transcriptional regulator n=1 Tax=Rhodospirillum rubrum TaxID=1085 RepID=UPI001904F7FF|nr:LysR family transcriptional regulator [Rhodospirillum rubrum]MBK1663867.1 LysR family transcriptional regulator [Rhodospirillum rubrum]MBK1675889.1 LysR family transcriptional regulator [Rhodospirillum rubrum]
MAEADLHDLDAFVAVARARSFRGAATLRGVSASALSTALRRLEGQLGVRLLNRTTRSVTPTEAGQRLLDRLGPAFGEIAGALDAVASLGDQPSGTLRLNVPSIVARHVLPAIAARFLIAHPAITLEVTTNDSFIDVLAAGFDAGIRYDERIERDMIAVPLGPRIQRFIAAGAPSYLARRGVPATPRALIDHACIRHRFASGVILPWEFSHQGQVLRIAPNGPLVSTSIDISIAAAIAGLGLIYTFEEYLRAPLARGELVAVLADWGQSFSGPFVYFPSRRQMPTPLRAFIDFLRDDVRTPPSPRA